MRGALTWSNAHSRPQIRSLCLDPFADFLLPALSPGALKVSTTKGCQHFTGKKSIKSFEAIGFKVIRGLNIAIKRWSNSQST